MESVEVAYESLTIPNATSSDSGDDSDDTES